jgi:carboxyl-terminal processing protease
LPTYRGAVAILVDGCSASTSEILAEGMKDLGRARVFGTRTAGAALPSAIDKLPNGDGFQHAVADYISEGGKSLEGAGVIPDVEVKLTQEALLAGRDPVLEAAIEWIHSRK